jgi:hypothetical protein
MTHDTITSRSITSSITSSFNECMMIQHHHGNAAQNCPPLLGEGKSSIMSVWLCQIEPKDLLPPTLFFSILSLTLLSALVRKEEANGNGIYLAAG